MISELSGIRSQNASLAHFLAKRAQSALGERIVTEAVRTCAKEKEDDMASACTHLDHIHQVTPSANGCEDCLKTGDTWVHLRMCLECGHVGCCDSSKNKHATKHFHETQHPIMQSAQPGESWRWCYVDEMMV